MGGGCALGNAPGDGCIPGGWGGGGCPGPNGGVSVWSGRRGNGGGLSGFHAGLKTLPGPSLEFGLEVFNNSCSLLKSDAVPGASSALLPSKSFSTALAKSGWFFRSTRSPCFCCVL